MSDHAPPTPPQVEQEVPQGYSLAEVSLILAGLSWFCLWFLGSIPAVLIGHIAYIRQKGNKVAIAGIVLGYANIIVSLLFIVFVYFPAHEFAQRSTCAMNLREIGLIIEKIARKSEEGFYPELSPEPGNLMLHEDVINEYDSHSVNNLVDNVVFHCPTTTVEEPFSNQPTYVYLGYGIIDEEGLEEFAKAYRERVAAGGEFDSDLSITDGDTTKVIKRFRKGEETHEILGNLRRKGIVLKGIDVPVMWEWNVSVSPEGEIEFNHHHPGGNVLFTDGKNFGVRYFKWNERFPMTDRTVEILLELQALGD